MARRLRGSISKPRPARRAADAVVVVGLAGLADGAGDAQPPLQLVARVAQAGLQQSSSGVRPAVGLARPALDVERAVALGGDLLPRPAAAAVQARVVRVLVGGRGFVAALPARHAFPIGVWFRANITDALHLPCAPVSRLPRRTRLAGQHTGVVCHRILRACAASSQYCSCRDDVGFPLVC